MEENTPSLFEYNEETGEVEYTPSETNEPEATSPETDVSDPVATEGESEEITNAVLPVETTDTGNDVSNEVEDSGDTEETQETVVFNVIDTPVPVTLSDEVTTALIEATTPAGGSLGSTTLDYFDRIVSGLDYNYKYVAYRTNDDNTYDGVLYYGKHYDIEDGVITFGKKAKEVTVTRVSSSGYNTYTDYSVSDAEGADIELSQDGDVVYYTNAEVGYPIMGSYTPHFDLGSFFVSGMLVAFAIVVLQKIFLKR